MRLSPRLRVGSTLIFGACVASGDVPIRSASDLVTVRLEITGGTCAACWRSLEIEAPGVLVVEDDSGEERFELSTGEQASIDDLVSARNFQQTVDAPDSWHCSLLLDVEATVHVEWMDGSSQSAKLSDGCSGHCDKTEHPLMALKRLLFELKERYMQDQCPPNADRYPEYCGIAPEPPPPPESRMLCAACLDDCGVPIPEGSPPRAPIDP